VTQPYELVDSPLSTKVSRNGITVEVHIYRGKNDDEWVLEVVDHEGGSTVWRETFPSDREAMAAVMLTIEKEGIASFLADPSMKFH
jgi:uncharacterized protein